MRVIIILLFMLLGLNALKAQLTISGKIVDRSGEAIIGAQITSLHLGIHSHADVDGSFTIEVSGLKDTLQVYQVGYEPYLKVLNDLREEVLITLEIKRVSLEEIVISPDANAIKVITDIDLQTNPIQSSQEILRQVPGLFIGQHAGGGKAEQIFLRGFDIDHGTDIALAADGIPVNMVSHAHGQGYSDLHFIIPETIDNIDFGKGPYYASEGNFNTAGYVNFNTKTELEHSVIKLERGRFNTNRALGMFSLVNTEQHKSYLASEYLASDGPFESSQNFHRINLFGKYTVILEDGSELALLFSHFTSEWDASGQIPQRAVDQGLISRFGAIDDTEGGETGRTNVSLSYNRFLSDNRVIKNQLYFSKYDFELFSNFTFFLEDPVNSDQIKQGEDRSIYGLNSEYQEMFAWNDWEANWKIGGSIRIDQSSNNSLFRTKNRDETLEMIRLGDIDEVNMSLYSDISIDIGKFTIQPGIRLEHFDFQYEDALSTTYEILSNNKSFIAPKLNLLYQPTPHLQTYVKMGRGFHSNDSRLVLQGSNRDILPAAYGVDVGILWKPSPRLLINTAYWNLYMEQEFVYVGDAGIVEPSGRTTRQGLEWSMRYQLTDWFFWNFDLNVTRARGIIDEGPDEFIPLAPDFTFVTAGRFLFDNGWYGSVHLRYIKDRPANEDNTIVALGYAITDMNIGYQWRELNLGVQIQNLFNQEWNEAQFATESRLRGEAEPVEELHFTPGTPFALSASLAYNF